MSLINNIRSFPSQSSHPRHVLLLCGFGGATWQTHRLIRVLGRAGYRVTALDFSKEVLRKGDLLLLLQLVDEVVSFAETEAKKNGHEVLLIGISLGALLALNILRRSPHFSRSVMITGGNIVTVARKIYPNKWPQSHAELSDLWKSVNMFSDPLEWKRKKAIFVLPVKDRLVDTQEVMSEIYRQNQAGNDIKLIQRKSLGHIGTIIEETILFPRRTLDYIKALDD